MAIAALDAGKDVLLEKPMASTIAECDEILAAVRRTGRVLSIGHEFRISTQWGFIKRLIAAGEIGEPLYANVSLFRFPYRQGSGGWRYGRDTRRLLDPRGAGAFLRHADVVVRGARRSRRACTASATRRGAAPGMYDNFSAVMRWPGGAYAVVTQTLAGFEHHHVVEVVGREGSIRTWWSGTMDRTLDPDARAEGAEGRSERLRNRRARASGEVFELEEELARRRRGLPERRAAGLGRGGAQDASWSASRPSGPWRKGRRSR